jgi:electron transport complex protein RnfD
MLWKKIITWHIPVSIIVTVAVFSALMHVASPVYANPVQVILSGGLMLGAIFMATDYVTSPMTHKGQLHLRRGHRRAHGGCPQLGQLSRGHVVCHPHHERLHPLINFYVKPKRFGEAVAKKKED